MRWVSFKGVVVMVWVWRWLLRWGEVDLGCVIGVTKLE